MNIELLYQILVFIIHGKNIKSSYDNNNFKISAQTWKNKFELPYGPYSVPDIQDYFENILKKHGENTDNQLIKIHVKNRK